MKTAFISGVLLCAFTVTAQTGNKQTTVRIKQVKNINGVETVTDTTFSTNDPASVKLQGADISIRELKGGNHATAKTIIIHDNANGNTTEEMEKRMAEQELTLHGLLNDSIDLTGKTLTLKKMNCNGDKTIFGDAEQIEIFIVKKIQITDADEADMQRLKKQAGKTDGKLTIEKMNFYPNPSSGKFNLSFSLPEKGDADITIMNQEGKVVYSEKLPAFSGNYDKEIDISKQAKGIYFVKVEQGRNSQVKKIVLE